MQVLHELRERDMLERGSLGRVCVFALIAQVVTDLEFTGLIGIEHDRKTLRWIFVVHAQRMRVHDLHRMRRIVSVEQRYEKLNRTVDLELADRERVLDGIQLTARALPRRHLVEHLMMNEASKDLLEGRQRPQRLFPLALSVVDLHGRVEVFATQKRLPAGPQGNRPRSHVESI